MNLNKEKKFIIGNVTWAIERRRGAIDAPMVARLPTEESVFPVYVRFFDMSKDNNVKKTNYSRAKVYSLFSDFEEKEIKKGERLEILGAGKGGILAEVIITEVGKDEPSGSKLPEGAVQNRKPTKTSFIQRIRQRIREFLKIG